MTAILTKEQMEAEKTEHARLIREIDQLINKVPRSVLEGNANYARNWKSKAHAAMMLSRSKKPSVDNLRSAVQCLKQFL